MPGTRSELLREPSRTSTGKPLGMRERPRRLRVDRERQIAARPRRRPRRPRSRSRAADSRPGRAGARAAPAWPATPSIGVSRIGRKALKCAWWIPPPRVELGDACRRCVRSESGVAPTTNCIVIPATPPGRSGSARAAVALLVPPLATTSAARARASPASSSRLFSGAMRASVCAARRLEVDRHAAGERGEPLDLRRLRARHELDVDVAGEAVRCAEQLEHGDQVVHDLHRPAGNAGGDEEPLAPAAARARRGRCGPAPRA